MDNLPNAVIELVEETTQLIKSVHFSFPNGSSYSRYQIPTRLCGLYGEDGLKVFRRTETFEVRTVEAIYYFKVKQLLGPGVDLGVHFYNRSSTGYKVELEEIYKRQ